ncbi:MAG: phage minor head protein, partial [Candidatus Shapirobacteria bacterium]
LNVAMGEKDAARMVGAALTGQPVILPGFNRLNQDAIIALLGFLSPEGELYKRVGELAGATSDYVIEKLLEGVTLGYNPKKIARAFGDAYGRGLTDALRMVRTVQLYSYREANRASYSVNQNAVSGWIWGATLDGLTCPACLAMHGTLHKLDERLNGHHNCRCAMIPVTTIFPPAITETGEEWFSKQPEAKQRALLGGQYYDAWKGGAYKFSDLAGTHTDKVYGDMRVREPLWKLLGAEPPVRK